MTTDWTFTLITANQWYNLWTLITNDPSFTDSKFTSGNYVPNMVCELKYQNQTAGSNITLSDNKLESGFILTGGSWDVSRSSTNTIDLNRRNFKSDTAGTVIYVSIVSL